jgi:hypothetical protein
MTDRQFPTVLTALSAAIAGALLSATASGQTTLPCSGSTALNCQVSGTYSQEIFVHPTGNNSPVPTMTVGATADITVSVQASTTAALKILSFGDNGNPSGTLTGGDTQGLTVTNSGNLTLQGSSTAISGDFYGLFAQMLGGNGVSSSDGHDGGNGGVAGRSPAQILSLTNSGAITMTMPSVSVTQGAALSALSEGGVGGETSEGSGGAGGQSMGVTLVNTGGINVTLTGTGSYAGIQAVSKGGSGASNSEGNGLDGGGGGAVSVINSGAVALNWNWNSGSDSGSTLYGIQAQAQSGNGGTASLDGNGGNAGQGAAQLMSASMTLNAGGNVKVTQTGAPPGAGAGAAVIIKGGKGGDAPSNHDDVIGGNGGDAGQIQSGKPVSSASAQFTDTDASVTTSGDKVSAIVVTTTGGNGGGNFSTGSYHDLNGGRGGIAGDGSILVSALTTAITFSTDGSTAPGVVALLQGGAGAAGGFYGGDIAGLGSSNAGNGGAGGNAGQINIALNGQSQLPISVKTTGSDSAGVYAFTGGGKGADGGALSGTIGGGAGGIGGAGGRSGDVNVTLASTVLTTLGDNSPGVVAQSIGASGGTGGTASQTVANGAPGGAGGSSGNVSVSIDGASSITTQGVDAIGILAQSASGGGGNGGGSDGELGGTGGAGGAGGNTGAVTVSNNGVITTSGNTARGILAQSLSGSGGAGADGYGVFYSGAGTGGSSGEVGTVNITNIGTISTAGSNAQGILAQSVAGGGGAGGQAGGLIWSVGGNSTTNPFTANGNLVSVNGSSGSITTTGTAGIGILGQSIGGGGGDGGGSTGIVSIGGTGGLGGAGGVASANLSSVKITTSGDGAHGIVMQSVGGGGGNAGNAGSTGLFVSVALGGTAGDGGAGGNTSANLTNTTISASGTKAAGLIAQSVGGGGGTGGQAFASSVGMGFSASVALGGTGGSGGNGAPVSSQMIGGSIATGQNPLLIFGAGACGGSCAPIAYNTLPVDAYGAVVQSIGGGGGLGGSASAQALALSVPVVPSGSVQFALASAVSMGGAGGSGGDGEYVTFAASQGAQITTSGQGGTGVLIQSIGGGGGAGGDSSALAASAGYGTLPDEAISLSVTPTFTVGGSGGVGGNGAAVSMALGGLINVSNGVASFTPDAAGTSTSRITTFGDYANGVKAQSIGGGGGDAGFGTGNTQAFGSGYSLTANVSLGSTGGSGGDGGAVQVQVLPTAAITTYGSGAIGVIAQSIGGGGGTSQGGSINVGISASNISPTANLAVGTKGGGGGSGSTVIVDVDGSIITSGGDAVGVLAQSIGGGGGLGGSAGSDASADNPVIAATFVRAGVTNITNAAVADSASGARVFKGSFSVALGGTGGAGNTGGAVTVNLGAGGFIQTAGDWASGIVAQSVGGGGGKGGIAAATGIAHLPDVTINSNVTLGGSGGLGADGGQVTTNLSGGAIKTAGYAASGVLAQSIGGGGGWGADGSDKSGGLFSVGSGNGGSGVAGGVGGNVTLVTKNSNTITTTGEGGFGAVLQSVGGSGGYAGSGSGQTLGLGPLAMPATQLVSGSQASYNSGGGGTVAFQDQGSITFNTYGNNAFGILAQSIGGGGGIIANSQAQLASSVQTSIYGSKPFSDSVSDGGAVNVTLGAASRINTSGTGAHGIVAQSVGGGGGIIGLPNTGAILTIDRSKVGTLTPGSGSGGDVTVTVPGTISVTGDGAVGILAQSVGAGGGLQLGTDGNSVYAGSAMRGVMNDATVTVNVPASGYIGSHGMNSVAIFAQNTNGSGGVKMTIDGLVVGGGGPGASVWIDSVVDSTLTIGQGGELTQVQENAILATGSALGVTNNGTIQGSVALNGGKMVNNGSVMAGVEFEGDLVNNGLVALGGKEGRLLGYQRTRFAQTTLTGDFSQSASGVLQVGADFNALVSDKLLINGPATLDGGVLIAPRALLPKRELSVLTVNGTQADALTAVDSPVFDYSARQSGQETYVHVASANFNANSMGLAGNQSEVGKHLQQGWDLGGSSALSTLYAVLDTASRTGAGEYQARLTDLSPGVALAPAAQMQFAMARFTGAMMSCPTFNAADSSTKEQNCFWGEVSGRRTKQDGVDRTSSFSYDSTTYQFGGQREIAPNTFLGGSMAYQNSRLAGDDRRVSGSGDAGYAGIVLKRQVDQWTFSGALGGGYGSYDMDRNLNIARYGNTAKSSPNVYSFGARLRAARTFAQGSFYLKPYVDLDATYSRMPGYTESGDALRLKVDGSDQFVLGVAPTLELGGRVDLPKGAMMRPFAYAGVSLLSEDGWKTKARLDGAPAGAGSFTTSMPTDNVIGRVGAGFQVLNAAGLDFRLQYDGEFASKGSSHAGALKVSMPF